MNILVTGATGFVGRTLCAKLLGDGGRIFGTLLPHESPTALVAGVEPVLIEPFGSDASYEKILNGIDTVIHLAARVHVMHETAHDPLSEFRKTNTTGTVTLARQAAAQGVKRFVFMSTIGVNGDNSGARAYTEFDAPQPHNPYSVSKHEAEVALHGISVETGMQVVVVRAPLVYGPGNSGNFLALLKIVSKGMPLPFASVPNSRSLIYVGNLVDAISLCAVHSESAGEVYLVSDGEDVSTPELIRRTAAAVGAVPRLFAFPSSLMRLAGWLTGKTAAVNRLLGSVTLDGSKIRRQLGWQPPFTMEEGLRETGKWFISSNRSSK